MSSSWKVGRKSCIWWDQLQLAHEPIIYKSRISWSSNGKSPLIDSGIDCIMRFLLDYMHLVCGMKRLLLFRIEGPRPFRLAPIQISQIAERLKQHDRINSLWVCSTTQRLDELKRWKATELRAFLLYPGPIVLKGILRPEKYIHFFVTIGLHKNLTRWTL